MIKRIYLIVKNNFIYHFILNFVIFYEKFLVFYLNKMLQNFFVAE